MRFNPELSKKYFMHKYNIAESSFKRAGVSWEELLLIKADFEKRLPLFSSFTNEILNTLNNCGAMHSIKIRMKDSEHLIEKIIRKNIENAERTEVPAARIGLENYIGLINDIIGVRVLHLFKDEWAPIHAFIMNSFNLVSPPCAYIREGDWKNIIEAYESCGCVVLKHPYGYRSVHYVIQNADRSLRAEIQVRTLFEEAWSEIDHKIRYPYFPDDEILKTYSLLLNRLAGSADEISASIKLIKAEVENMKYDSVEKSLDLLDIIERKNAEIERKNAEIKRLRARLAKIENGSGGVKKNKKVP